MDGHEQNSHGIEVLYRPANPLEECDPPVPALAPGTRLIPAGSVHAEGARPVPVDIEVFEDVAIPLRDGVTLYGDVYRPAGAGPLPAVLIYTPYIKRGGHFNTTLSATRFGVPAGDVSGLQPVEALDPAYWCEHDYALVVVDARGTGHSGGDMLFHGRAEGRDAYDTVEWIAAQEWSTGKVAMAGNSQLAMVQWAAAALRPPHLTAIAPWEGLTDVFRDVVGRGGIPDVVFHDNDIIAFLYGTGRFEDLGQMVHRYPLDNAYWADKRPDLSVVDIPAYVVASWSNPIHTRNTLKAFEQLPSERKWLRLHNTQEWVDIATPENVDDLRRFYDRYLKDEDNGWESTPRVRYAVLDPGGKDIVDRTSDSWPPVRPTPTTLHLDAATGSLTREAPASESSVSYTSTDPTASARFRYTVERETELLGPLNVRLWVQTSEGNDLDLFAALYKTDADGKPLYHFVFPALKELTQSLGQDGKLPSALAYSGPLGRIRASHRALDAEKSTTLEPYLSHEREDLVEPGVAVQLDLGLWPTGMLIHPGETLVLEIAGHFAGPLTPPRTGESPDVELPTRNAGTHTIRTGGRYGSRLFLPVVS
ncbi:CocE/NonD family hydrolase [Streptomyces sp. NPDC051987]|uniref:CocE/NonD family hydrolase n=1 Tax=Streptomyces sp. NPDC051987 TaxID=3155808 RepID=UPI003431FE6C